jgi:hypothetical protein
MPRKHQLPEFLVSVVSADLYERWLTRKAAAHVKRDRKRGRVCANSAYKEAIHRAVIACNGKDSYTREDMNWSLISTYRNEDSRAGRHAYKAEFALLPTVDHHESDVPGSEFRICAWRTNDAKNDLSVESFIALCKKVLENAGFSIIHSGN